MSDRQGRTLVERMREKSFEGGFHDDQREELKQALKSQNIEALKKFVSRKSMFKKLIPQLLVGILLGYIEYSFIGILYTVVSLAVIIPPLTIYSRSLRNRTGTFIMVPTSDLLDWERLFISEEIWSLMEKTTGLTLESGKINGRMTYWCTAVDYIDGTNIPFHVDIAWAHYNRAKYMMFSSVLDDLTTMLKDSLLEIAKLRKIGMVETIVEATKQSGENIDAITSAYRDDVMSVLSKQKISQEEADVYEKEVNELLQNPEYIRALIKKKQGEAE